MKESLINKSFTITKDQLALLEDYRNKYSTTLTCALRILLEDYVELKQRVDGK